VVAWNDESHVTENRRQYQQKRDEALDILRPVLPVTSPAAGFYLWVAVPGGGESFARALYAHYNVTVLPGAYLSRPETGENPGSPYVRIALVATLETNRAAMHRIAACARARLRGI
jgi:N-succinyldiaminopimelate aminotransferase